MTQQEFEYLYKRAHEGKKNEIYKLAKLYYTGSELPQDYTQSLTWFEMYLKVGGQFEGEVNYLLGMQYFNGDGCEQDQLKAIELFIDSYRNGYSQASDLLEKLVSGGAIPHLEYVELTKPLPANIKLLIGEAYLKGTCGVSRDITKGFDYIDKAYNDSMDYLTKGKVLCLMGECCEKGLGKEVDYDAALNYYQQAYQVGNYQGIQAYNRLKASIQSKKAELERQQRAEEERKRKEAEEEQKRLEAEEERKRKEAEEEQKRLEAEEERKRKEEEFDGLIESMNGDASQQKDFVQKRESEALMKMKQMLPNLTERQLEVVKKTLEKDSAAMFKLGMYLVEGREGFEKDTDAGWTWIFKASRDLKNHHADYYIGKAYKDGNREGLRKNKSMAKKYLAKAANAGISNAASEYNSLLSLKEVLFGKRK